jgi:large subunit ribosomal protein L15
MSKSNSLSLSTLAPTKGARKRKIRVGRGESSGAGKTAGRGGKGQKGRAGATVRRGFEGGQMPLYRRVPKLGFFSRKKTLGLNRFQVVSLTALNEFKEGALVSVAELASAGVVRKNCKVKVLATGEITKKISVKVHAISEGARQKIEAAGGVVELIA